MVNIPTTSNIEKRYRGRFAPSPSGPLHFGSLIAALGSYLRTKSKNGIWLVRIDDIDPPREQKGATQHILQQLERYGLFWDEAVFYQSKQVEVYESALQSLLNNQQAYYCQCTRKLIKYLGGAYDGACRDLNLPATANSIRLKNLKPILSFNDVHFAKLDFSHDFQKEDFIIKRRDGLYAYQLAVVIDDIQQGITEVVRGADLLETTPKQLSLYDVLGYEPPQHLHLPIAVSQPGLKLSKQNHATPIATDNDLVIKETLIGALHFLGLETDKNLSDLSISQLLEWAVNNWSIKQLPKVQEITV